MKDNKAKELKEIMIKLRGKTETKATLKDLNILLQCKETGEYTPMFTTKLYNNYSVEYCMYLELLAS